MTLIEKVLTKLAKYIEILQHKYYNHIILQKRNYARDHSNMEKRVRRVRNAVRVYKRNPTKPPVSIRLTIIDRQLGLYYK